MLDFLHIQTNMEVRTMYEGKILEEIIRLFQEIKLRKGQKGYYFLCYGLQQYYQYEEKFRHQIYHLLFQEIAEKFNTNRSCVERNIRYVLEATWTREYSNQQYDYYDSIIHESGKPSSADFIVLSKKILDYRFKNKEVK